MLLLFLPHVSTLHALCLATSTPASSRPSSSQLINVIMAPSAVVDNETAEAVVVPQSANTAPYDGTQTPPAIEVASSLDTEPEMKELFGMKKTTTIVTGGARGLGLTIAAAVLESGGDVYCCDILDKPSEPEWTSLLRKAKRYGGEAHYDVLDICDVEKTNALFRSVAQRARFPLKGLVHSAGTMHESLALDYEMEPFRRILKVNVEGTMIVAQATARIMKEHGLGGSIVLIASMSGSIANRGLFLTAYNSSKSAVLQMCRSLAVEWGEYGIRVNTVSPGYVRTAMTNLLLQTQPEKLDRWESDNPLHRIALPHEIKGPAMYLLSPASSFVTGFDARVDGGHCAW
ncbi:oxidoreductase [Ceraceosorus guamensis]|uniref:Oxidoreductase n=1 Tax=Ceraceosorus guamensis TaxID=1522189 RepID=A0A316VU60_9BASI|nr:oxidoreductase [Ceraceosorus guamensis]PWN40960.1 oxidoreductase [Ceraceosorus guamensis]